MSSSAWKTYKFNDILEIPLRNGVNRPRKVRGSGYKMVNMGELFAHSIIGNIDMEYVPMSENDLQEYLLKKGDLLFARQSLTVEGAGKCSIFWSEDKFTTFEGHLIRARVDSNIAFPQYLYYYFQSYQGMGQIRSLVSVTAAAGIRNSDLGNLYIPLPPLATQQRIAAILSALDEKIALNRQLNETLEAIAQALFKQWFVDFNYPGATGEMQDSALGMIPIGWRVGTLGEICELVKGVSYKSSDLVPSTNALVTLKSINRGGGFNIGGFKEYAGIYKEQQLVNEGDVIIAQTDITQNADVVGSPAIVENPFDYEQLIASLDIVKCNPKLEYIPSELLYLYLRQQSFKDYCISHTNGSTVLHLRSSELPKYPLVLAPDTVSYKFTQIVVPMIYQMLLNNKENLQIAEVRDKLLPKLMRGEIVV